MLAMGEPSGKAKGGIARAAKLSAETSFCREGALSQGRIAPSIGNAGSDGNHSRASPARHHRRRRRRMESEIAGVTAHLAFVQFHGLAHCKHLLLCLHHAC
jgi:hypothetical protein